MIVTKLVHLIFESPSNDFLENMALGLPFCIVPVINTKPDFAEYDEPQEEFCDDHNPLLVKIISLKPGEGVTFVVHFKVAAIHPYIESGEYTLTFDGTCRICENPPQEMLVKQELSEEELEGEDEIDLEPDNSLKERL